MAKVVFINKNKKLIADGETYVEPGQLYYQGVSLDKVVGKLSYVPFYLHCSLGHNASPEQLVQFERVFTMDATQFISESELHYIAQVKGGSYSKLTALINYIGGKFETGILKQRMGVLRELNKDLGLDGILDPALATVPLILNTLPKLYAVIDGRKPDHQAATFIESFFINVLGRVPNELSDKELIVWDTYLVSLCAHGLTSPSYHGFRVSANTRAPFTSALQAWLTAAAGDLHFGAIGGAIYDLREVEREGITHSEHIQAILDNGFRVSGYGHRMHPRLLANYPHGSKTNENHRNIPYREDLQTDPRVRINFACWRALDYQGKYIQMTRQRAKEAFTLVGCANVDTMAAGLYLDLGLKQEHTLLGPFIARLPHLMQIYIQEATKTRPNKYIGLKERE
ncbi:hypothetical protein IID20_03210 [Patescibacteria group bacterium]|nr:hypothetical protein [Patescibacteria group bacterium]